jgi:hypothetical protein
LDIRDRHCAECGGDKQGPQQLPHGRVLQWCPAETPQGHPGLAEWRCPAT